MSSSGGDSIIKIVLDDASSRVGSAVSSAFGASVGSATGSGTIGGIAGVGAGVIAGAAGKSILALGPLAAPIVGLGVAAIGTVEALKTLTRVANDAVSSLHEISGVVNLAEGMREVKRIEMLLERDKRIGGASAGLINAKTDVEMSLENIKTSIARIVIPIMEAIYKAIAQILKSTEPIFMLIAELGPVFAKFMGDISTALGMLLNVIDSLVGDAIPDILARTLFDLGAWLRDSRNTDVSDELSRELDKFLNPDNPDNPLRTVFPGLPPLRTPAF